jgi:hypothetical protein
MPRAVPAASRGAGRPAATSRAGRRGKIKKIISLDSKKNFIWRFACKLVVFTALIVEKKNVCLVML